MTVAPRTFALLRAQWSSGHDFLDTLLPFLNQCIRESFSDVVSLSDTTKALEERFGLPLPSNVVKALLKRAKKGHMLFIEGQTYRRNPRAPEYAFAETEAQVQSQVEKTIHSLCEFAKAHEREWTEAEGEAALLAFIEEYDFTASLAVASAVPMQMPSPPANSSFVVASFINHALTENNSLIPSIDTILQGYILATALRAQTIAPSPAKFDNTTIILDTPIVISALGYNGVERSGPALELVAILKEHKAHVACFRRTVDEIRGILVAQAHSIATRSSRHNLGSSLDHFIRSGTAPSTIEILAAQLENNIPRLGIQCIDQPPVDRDYQVDEGGFESLIEKEIEYHHRAAIVHDASCIASVARMRRGHHASQIERCRAIFATMNSKLARLSSSFFVRDCRPGTIGLCITDEALCTMLWLKNPVLATNLPRRQLIAQTYAALQPSTRLWSRFLAEIAALESDGSLSDDDCALLRYSTTARRVLMEVTEGEDSVFSEGTTQQVLEVAKANIRADLETEVTRLKREVLERERESLAHQAKALSYRQQIADTASLLRRASRVTFAIFCAIPLLASSLYGTRHAMEQVWVSRKSFRF